MSLCGFVCWRSEIASACSVDGPRNSFNVRSPSFVYKLRMCATRTPMRTRILISFALIALGAFFIVREGNSQQAGQSQPPAGNPPSSDNTQPVLKNKAYEVVLPVTVRDKKGVLVTSLQKSDFTLTEEG